MNWIKIVVVIFLAFTLVSCNANSIESTSETVSIPVPQSVPAFYKDEAAVAYQIFPIAFADSDGNGIGDINGITRKLDYLKNDLFVDIIWLNPVHPSPSYHKYDVTDYYGIDPSLGTLEDYKNLIKEAHKRDIKILLDFVINHTSSAHPWFMSAKSDKDSPYRDYYVWGQPTKETHTSTDGWYSIAGTDEKYFASFWSEMPELNFENPEVRSELKSIAKFWMDLGVDGFRIDAAKHIYDIKEYPKGTPVLSLNHQWFIEFNDYIKNVNPEAFLLLETWDNYSSVSHYLEGSDSAFNFDMGSAILSAVKSEYRKNLQDKLTKVLKSYNQITTEYVDSIFIANHDQDRTMSQLENNIEKAKLAATIEFTLPGISWIYYGEEIGMTGRKPDENIREGFKWNDNPLSLPNSRWRTWNYNVDTISLESQISDETSIFNHYKRLTALKNADEVIQKGTYIDLEIGTSFRIFSFYRTYENKTYLVLHNLHGASKMLKISGDSSEIVFTTNGSSIEGQVVTLQPYGSLVINVSSTTISVEEIDK